MPSQITVSAPGKIIISGEHAVVHGYPALVTAVDKRIKLYVSTLTKSFSVDPLSSKKFVRESITTLRNYINSPFGKLNIVINSDIPIGRGMGSSAAYAVAISKALLLMSGKNSGSENTSKLAYELEKKYHGNPSGVDISISTMGGVLWFRKETEDFKIFSRVDIKQRLPELFLYDTGKPEETTKETVGHVSELLKKSPSKIDKVFREIEKVSRGLLEYITRQKNYDLGSLLQTNERLLEELGVVSPSTKLLIRSIENMGGVAKITGGGGLKKASGMILIYHPVRDKLVNFAEKRKLRLNVVKFGAKGVTIEK